MTANMADHSHVDIAVEPFELAVDQGAEDTATGVAAAVAADEDGGLPDGMRSAEV